MSNNQDRVVNTGLRSATLCARFVFIFFLAKYLEPASVGYYGLFTAAVGYCLYIVGLDFYTYTTREILKTPNERRGSLVKGQAALSVMLYIIVLPIAFLLLQQAAWPPGLVLWFFPILVLEHLNQELSRLLIAFSQQITATLILFFRQGSWALAIVVLMTWNEASRTLPYVLGAWTIAGLVAAALGLWKLWRLQMGGWRNAVDWQWVRTGIMVSGAFLVATLALRGIQVVDRYWLEFLTDIEFVGAYVVFIGIAATLLTFLDAAVFAFAYPGLITLHHEQQYQMARRKVKAMLAYTFLISVGFGVVSWLVLPHLLGWIGNPVYMGAIYLYPWLLSAMIIHAFSMVPHYALYARHRDKPIIFSHIAGLAVFVPSVWVFSTFTTTLAVPAGLNIAFAIILAWKSIAYLLDDKKMQSEAVVPQVL